MKKYQSVYGVTVVTLLMVNPVSAGDWSGVVSGSIGHDDNVTLGDDSNILASNQKDYFFDFLGTTGKYLTGNKDDGVRLTGTLFNREYDTEDDFNFLLVSGGLAYHKKLGRWHGRFGAKYGYLEFGGDPYETVLTLTGEGRHKFNRQTEFRIRYRYSDINSESRQFNNLDGDRHQLRFQGRFKQGKNRYRLSYTFETNDRNDRSSGTSFSSSSPVRHTLRANAKFPLTSKWGLEFDARYRDSRYKDDNVSGGVSTRRSDDRFRAKAELSYKINRKTDVYVNYIRTENDSNISQFDYDRNESSVGVNYLF